MGVGDRKQDTGDTTSGFLSKNIVYAGIVLAAVVLAVVIFAGPGYTLDQFNPSSASASIALRPTVPVAKNIVTQANIKTTISLRPPACGGTQVLCGGSCTDTGSDRQNCGACGKVCSDYPNMNGTCSGGTCSYTCSKSYMRVYEDCNKNTADGCEVNLASDPNNCGTCGNVCSAGLVCFSSCQKPLSGGGAAETLSPPPGLLK